MKVNMQNIMRLPFENSHTIFINNPTGKENLINQIYTQLAVPYLPSCNFDALADTLQGLEWIKSKYIIIINNKLSKLDTSTLNTYLEILEITVKWWQTQSEHSIIILLPDNV